MSTNPAATPPLSPEEIANFKDKTQFILLHPEMFEKTAVEYAESAEAVTKQFEAAQARITALETAPLPDSLRSIEDHAKAMSKSGTPETCWHLAWEIIPRLCRRVAALEEAARWRLPEPDGEHKGLPKTEEEILAISLEATPYPNSRNVHRLAVALLTLIRWHQPKDLMPPVGENVDATLLWGGSNEPVTDVVFYDYQANRWESIDKGRRYFQNGLIPNNVVLAWRYRPAPYVPSEGK